MNIEQITLCLTDRAVPMAFSGGTWLYEDVTVSIIDSSISVCSKHTPIKALRVTFEKTPVENCLVLGDAWERAYADLGWKKPDGSIKMPWYFFAFDGTSVHCFGVKTQPNALCYWQFDGEQCSLTLDLRSGTDPVLLEGRTLAVCTVITDKK